MRGSLYSMSHRFFLPALIAIFALLAPLTSVEHRSYALDDSRYFPETGRTVMAPFYDYWLSHGGLSQQGYPISDEMQEVSDTDGKTYTVQYFERSIMEQHPEYAGTPNEVLLSLLGVFLYQQKYPNGAPGQSVDSDPGVKTFPETGYHLGGTFLRYWQSHGGLAQQGEAISEEFDEVSAMDGQKYRVQYFERAVFELHPEYAGTPNEVLLSQLGTFRYRAKYQSAPPSQPTASPGTPATPAGNVPCPADFLAVPVSGFEGCFNYWDALGYSPVTLAVYGADNATYVAGSFQKVDPVRLAIWNMTLADFQSYSVTFQGEHYAPDQVSVQQTSSGPRFTAVWSQTLQPLQYDTSLTYDEYLQVDDARRAQGYANTDVWSYMATGGVRFGGTWIERSFSDYKTLLGLDLNNYQGSYDPYIQQGFRPVRFEPFAAAPGKLVSMILEKTPGTWELSANITQDQAQAACNDLATLGYRLYSVRVLDGRFSIVWYKP